MKLLRRQFLHLAAGAAALPVLPRIARTQAYPSRPVTMIVPFAPGGATDVVGRIVGEYLSRILGQQFVIENVAGAGGTTGITRGVAGAAGWLHDHDGSYGHARRGARALSKSQI